MSVEVITFGCRLNTFEATIIRREAEAAGLSRTIIINSCAVTNEAVAQARQSIRKLKRERPDARIVVTGCAAQTQAGMFADMSEVDRVIGNDDKMRGAAWRATRAFLDVDGGEKIAVSDIMAVKEMAPHLVDGFASGLPRVFVQVQNGCDHRCTFCIIPYGRGPSRSVPAGEVVASVRHLVDAGYPEVVLTGVDITDYGAGLPGEMTLGKLVRQILRHVPKLKRLRLSSIDQVEADAHLLRAIAEEPRLMPHLHLSLQAGDNLTLKRMRRRHSRADAVAFCATVRQLRPDVVFGADLIAGFPTETEDMFARSMDLVDDCGLVFLHVFPFSARPGTPAARMPQVARAIVKDRAARLRQKGAMALARYLEAQVGRDVEVLMERDQVGRTPGFAEMVLASSVPAGRLLGARVTGLSGQQLQGEALAPTFAS